MAEPSKELIFLCHVMRELQSVADSGEIAKELARQAPGVTDPEITEANERLVKEGLRKQGGRMRLAIKAVELMALLLDEEEPVSVLFQAMGLAAREVHCQPGQINVG